MCPAGYVLRSHVTQTGLGVCTCNEQIADLILCGDDQETLMIKVSSGEGEGGGEVKIVEPVRGDFQNF